MELANIILSPDLNYSKEKQAKQNSRSRAQGTLEGGYSKPHLPRLAPAKHRIHRYPSLLPF